MLLIVVQFLLFFPWIAHRYALIAMIFSFIIIPFPKSFSSLSRNRKLAEFEQTMLMNYSSKSQRELSTYSQ